MKKAINIAKDYTIFLILILLGILFTIGNPAFLRFNNIITILRQSCIMGILGMGEMALIIVGGLNLSMGSCVALSTVIIAIMTVKMSLPWWLAIIVVVIVNTLLGWLTGAVINKTKIVPMIGTMAISTIISGIAYLLCGGLPISGLPDIVKFFYQGNVMTDSNANCDCSGYRCYYWELFSSIRILDDRFLQPEAIVRLAQAFRH